MKKIISVLLVAVFTLSCLGIMASATESGACGESLTWTLDDGTLTISGTGAMNDYDARHAPWYDAAPSIKSAVIEDGVSSIGSSAFYFCKKLESITIGSGVTSIGEDAFYECAGLTDITIPGSVTSIGNGAFFGCIGLTSITIPAGVTSIDETSFLECKALQNIGVNSKNNNFCSVDGVLYNKSKTKLICYPIGKQNSSFTVPGSVTSIGALAFYECTGLEGITIPDSVTSIGSHAFNNCTSLKDVYYAGSDKNDITIKTGNGCLVNAEWHYETQSGFFDNIISKVSSFFAAIGNKVSSIFEAIVEFFKNLF